MKSSTINQLKSVVTKINKSKANVAKERDKLRVLHSELEDLLETFDSGIDSLTDGVEEIERGIDDLSQFV